MFTGPTLLLVLGELLVLGDASALAANAATVRHVTSASILRLNRMWLPLLIDSVAAATVLGRTLSRPVPKGQCRFAQNVRIRARRSVVKQQVRRALRATRRRAGRARGASADRPGASRRPARPHPSARPAAGAGASRAQRSRGRP